MRSILFLIILLLSIHPTAFASRSFTPFLELDKDYLEPHSNSVYRLTSQYRKLVVTSKSATPGSAPKIYKTKRIQIDGRDCYSYYQKNAICSVPDQKNVFQIYEQDHFLPNTFGFEPWIGNSIVQKNEIYYYFEDFSIEAHELKKPTFIKLDDSYYDFKPIFFNRQRCIFSKRAPLDAHQVEYFNDYFQNRLDHEYGGNPEGVKIFCEKNQPGSLSVFNSEADFVSNRNARPVFASSLAYPESIDSIINPSKIYSGFADKVRKFNGDSAIPYEIKFVHAGSVASKPQFEGWAGIRDISNEYLAPELNRLDLYATPIKFSYSGNRCVFFSKNMAGNQRMHPVYICETKKQDQIKIMRGVLNSNSDWSWVAPWSNTYLWSTYASPIEHQHDWIKFDYFIRDDLFLHQTKNGKIKNLLWSYREGTACFFEDLDPKGPIKCEEWDRQFLYESVSAVQTWYNGFRCYFTYITNNHQALVCDTEAPGVSRITDLQRTDANASSLNLTKPETWSEPNFLDSNANYCTIYKDRNGHEWNINWFKTHSDFILGDDLSYHRYTQNGVFFTPVKIEGENCYLLQSIDSFRKANAVCKISDHLEFFENLEVTESNHVYGLKLKAGKPLIKCNE